MILLPARGFLAIKVEDNVIHLPADAGIVGQHFVTEACGGTIRKFFSHTLEKGFGIGKLLCIAIGIGDAAHQRLVLRETHPEAQIYIISILPVGAKATASQEMLNNDRVQMFNERIQGMCSEKQVYFVNGFEALAVNGSLPDDASPDGVHMQPSYCHKLTDYLLTHTVSA